jgi:EmrB/QacA subfamily drug resistance transporter
MSTKPAHKNLPENPYAHKWSAFAVVALATFMQAMDFSLINLSYPTLTKTFNTQLSTVVWLNMIFSLVVISFGMFFGKISDIAGRKKIFIFGSALMTFALIACSVSQNIGQLIFFRIIYSIGSAMITTCLSAIIADIFPPEERGKGMGLQNSSLFLGFTIAPFLAGILLSVLDWRSIFYVRIPIGVAIFIMSLFLLRKDKPAPSELKFDFAGTLASAAGFLCLIIGINLISRFSVSSPVVITLIIAGLLLITLFIYLETKAENPIVDLSLFKNILYLTGMLTVFLYWCALQGTVVTMSFYLTETLGWSVSGMGILFTASSIIMIITSSVCGPLSDRIGSLPLMIAGLFLSVVFFIIVWTFDLQTGIPLIVVVQLIGGIATGMFQPTNNSLIMGAVPPEKRGMASAMNASILHFGLALGMAWAGMFYSVRVISHKDNLIAQGIDSALSVKQAVFPAFHDVVIIAACIQILSLIFSIIPKIKDNRKKL